MTRGFSCAVMDIGVAYRENVDGVTAGINSQADSAVIIRCRALPLEPWGVKREYLRRLKAAFDEHGIEIPYPHMTVYAGQDRQGKAPAFPLQQLAEA